MAWSMGGPADVVFISMGHDVLVGLVHGTASRTTSCDA